MLNTSWLPWSNYKYTNSIAKRLTVMVLLFSSSVTFINTSVQVYSDYMFEKKGIQAHFDQIEKSNLPSIATSLWTFDALQLEIQLNGILQIPGIKYVEVKSGDGDITSAGEKNGDSVIERTFPISFRQKETHFQLGELRIIASMEGALERIYAGLVRILILQFLKTLCVSLFILYIFERIVNRHLRNISNHLFHLSPTEFSKPLTLDRDSKTQNKKSVLSEKELSERDELELLVLSVNRMQDNLKNSYQELSRLKSILDNTPDLVAIANLDGKIAYLNKGGEALLQWDSQDFSTKNFFDIFTKDSHSKLKEIAIPTAFSKKKWIGEATVSDKFGLQIPVSQIVLGHSSGQSFDAPDQDYISTILRDVSRAKRAERDLKTLYLSSDEARRFAEEAKQEAELANRTKDEFLIVLSHELRTPLTPILGWIELLKQDPSLSTNIVEVLATIERSSHAMLRLVNDLLDTSSMLKGNFSLEKSNVDLEVLLKNLIQTMKVGAELKNIKISYLSPASTKAEHPIVVGDTLRLQQIFWNLLSNAIKFTPRDGAVKIEVSAQNEFWCVSVLDNGVGISPEFFDRIFLRFSQADSSIKRAYGGLGLGLSLVRSLVELHGGSVKVHSEGKDKGSRFEVFLPISNETQISQPNLHPVSLSLQPLKSIGTITDQADIVCVDDDESLLEIFQLTFDSLGLKCACFSQALDALHYLTEHKHQVKLILSDLAMPINDGYFFKKQLDGIKALTGEKWVVIAVTAQTSHQQIDTLSKAGFEAYLEKPLRISDLKNLVKKYF